MFVSIVNVVWAVMIGDFSFLPNIFIMQNILQKGASFLYLANFTFGELS